MKNTPVKILKMSAFSEFLQPRVPDAHKGLYGHVLIVGGDYGFSGAPCMAAMASLRVGAGLVSVATRKEHAIVLNSVRPEIMCHGIDSGKELAGLIKKATVIAVGPGLGHSAWSKKILDVILKSNKPLVLDADALNELAKHPAQNDHWILTPHPGEAARLLGKTVADIQKNRLSAAAAIQKKYHGVCVLKGAGTLIVAEKAKPVICKEGNPGMATAGMGDLLTGVIAGLLAQHLSLVDAAQLGVLIHAKAGDSAAKEGTRGMIATDLLPFLRKWVNA